MQEGIQVLALCGRIPVQCFIQHIRRIWQCRMRECLHDHHHVQCLPKSQHACNLSTSLTLLSIVFLEVRQVSSHTYSWRQDLWSLRKRKVQTIETRYAAVQTTQTPSHPNHLNAPTRRRWSAAVSLACRSYTTTTSMTQQASSTTTGAQTTAATSLPSFDHSKLRLQVPHVTLPLLKQRFSANLLSRFLSCICCQIFPSHIKLFVASDKPNHVHTCQTASAGMHVQKSGDSRARLHPVHSPSLRQTF